MSTLRYRPDVDGLRAIAVVSVLLFHANLGFSGGYVGVDVFFVISGYLITSLIAQEQSAGTFSLAAFWERRIRRIFPAAAVVVVSSLAVGWLLFVPADFEALGKSVVAQCLLASNLYFYKQSGYFISSGENKPLLHTWSLSVEEQFYIFFPLLLLLIAKYRPKALTKTIAGLLFVSLIMSIYGSYQHEWATFYILPTRAWELLVGAYLAISLTARITQRTLAELASLAGFALLGFSIFYYTRDTRFPGVSALAPCVGAALLIASNSAHLTFVGRWLAWKPMVFVGLISYSLYLWHWPVFAFSTYFALSARLPFTPVILICLSFLLAVLSWRFVEQPFRTRTLLRSRRQIFTLFAVSNAGFICLGTLIITAKGFSNRFPTAALTCVQDKDLHHFLHNVSIEEAKAGSFPWIGEGHVDRDIDIVLWGDSHAMALTPVIGEVCSRHSLQAVQATFAQSAPLIKYTNAGKFSLRNDSTAFANAVVDFVVHRHVKLVILAAKWNFYPASAEFRDCMLSTVKTLRERGATVYIVKQVPEPGFNVPRLAATELFYKHDPTRFGVSPEDYRRTNIQYDRVFEQAAHEGARILDPSSYFLNSRGQFDIVRNGVPLYYDENHVTTEGAMLLKPMFDGAFVLARR